MTKIDIVSGFLGAGKTTLIKKLLAEAYKGEKLVLIENEFGEINIDGGFLKESGIQISEMSAGCICCSLVGDFNKALKDVEAQFHPDRILIEPSGVGKLSDVIVAVENTVKDVPDMKLNSFVTVADASKVKVYMKNFGEFYNNQIETANTIILSHTDGMKEEKLDQCVNMIREHNKDAVIVTTPWPELTGEQLMEAMEQRSTIAIELAKLEEEAHHHHHDHDHDHEHHHHDHEEHEHHHHDGECSCGCGHHHHDHEGHHHADEVFTSWGKETIHTYTKDEVSAILKTLEEDGSYGNVLRAKGMVAGADGEWIYFDMVPEEHEVRTGAPEYTGRICVIGAELNEDKLAELFKVK